MDDEGRWELCQNGTVKYFSSHESRSPTWVKDPDGSVLHYEKTASGPCLRRAVLPNGDDEIYTGDRGEERLMKVHRVDGSVYHFTGERSKERLVRVQRADGSVEEYEGASGAEHVVDVRDVPKRSNGEK